LFLSGDFVSNEPHKNMTAVDFTSRNDQDEMWGKVVDAIDDDSMWQGNNFDDFSVAAFPNPSSNLVAPTVVQKQAVPISRKKDVTTTPVAPRLTLSSARFSKSPGSDGKILKNKLTGMKAKATPIKSQQSRFHSDRSHSFQDDWPLPLEITTSNDTNGAKGILDSLPYENKAFDQSFEGMGIAFFDDANAGDKPDDGFAQIMSHKYNKSLSDIPTNGSGDLMQLPLEFLMSLETKNKNGSTRKNRIVDGKKNVGRKEATSSPNSAENDTELSPRSQPNEKTERRSNKSSSKRTEDVSTRIRVRRSRSLDNKKEKKGTPRSRSRGATLQEAEREKTSHSDRTTGKPDRSKREGRSIEISPESEGNPRPDRSERRGSRSMKKENGSNGRRSRSTGPGNPSDLPETKTTEKERTFRREISMGCIRVASKASEPPASPTKKINRGRRGSDKYFAPHRTKSEDLLDHLCASLGDQVKPGVSFEPSALTNEKKSPPGKRPFARAKSLVMPPSSKNRSRDLRNGLTRVDKRSGKIASKKCDELKSVGGTSTGTNSTKRSSSSSRGSAAADAEQAERLLKEQAKLVREQRKAEEAKLKRLQEESRLLEEKTRSEEMRLLALKEEAKILEARRMEEEARAKAEARIALEKLEEMTLKQAEEEVQVKSVPLAPKSHEATNAEISEMPLQNYAETHPATTEDEVAPTKEEKQPGPVEIQEQEHQGQDTLSGPRFSLSSSQASKKKFGGLPDNIQHLPPAFKLWHDRSKRAEMQMKTS
jgi:hypothetical protein